jgi:hypothetical protein
MYTFFVSISKEEKKKKKKKKGKKEEERVVIPTGPLGFRDSGDE